MFSIYACVGEYEKDSEWSTISLSLSDACKKVLCHFKSKRIGLASIVSTLPIFERESEDLERQNKSSRIPEKSITGTKEVLVAVEE